MTDAPQTSGRSAAARPRPGTRAGGAALLTGLVLVLILVGGWHLTQGTSGVGLVDLVRYARGSQETVGGVPLGTIFSGSRLPRLLAGAAVGFALGAAGCLLQSVTRNQLAAPDTLAVTSGSYTALVVVAAFGLSVPLWASGAVAVAGGLAAAALVLGMTGTGSGASTTRLVLAGSAISMALNAVAGMLLILFKEQTVGLFAWGNGSLAQLSIDASARALPVIAAVCVLALLMARRLDVLGLGDDTAASLGVSVRSTRVLAILAAVLLTAISVTIAGPIGFVGLGAPVLARLLGMRVPALHRHAFLIPVSGLLGALLVLLADVALRALVGAQAAASIPTGVPTAFLGALVIIVLARRMKESGTAAAAPAGAASGSGRRRWGGRRPGGGGAVGVRSSRRFAVVLIVSSALLGAALLTGMLAGSLWLRTGDIALWMRGAAPDLIQGSLDERIPRVLAAAASGAALGLAGCVVQTAARNPLAEPSILGITAGAGTGAVLATVTGGGRPLLVALALATGVATFALIVALAWRGGLHPDRFVLVGIGVGNAMSAVSTYLLLRADPYNTPKIYTWLSGTTYGRQFADVAPVLTVLAVTLPIVIAHRRDLDLLAIDEDTPRILGVRADRTRLALLCVCVLLAGASVVAIGVVGFVGLIAPHLARSLVGSRHARTIPVSMILGALLVSVADTLGRTAIAPSQIPAGLMIALIGAPYFVFLMRRSRTDRP